MIKLKQFILKNRIFVRCMVVLLIILIFLEVGLYNGLRVTKIEYSNFKVSKEFDGYKIVQITDLHSKKFGFNQEKLIHKIDNEEPDLIVFTGDMYDGYRWDYNTIDSLLAGISKIAPVYAITGNNEYDDRDMYDILLELYQKYGIKLLTDESVEITKGQDHFNLYGMYYRYYVPNFFDDIYGEQDELNILLYHDPTQFKRLCQNNFDLILAGHTHGGIIRLPFVGGVIGNRSGDFFPEYDYGTYEDGTTTMFVSTGLGDTGIPRFLNRPEIVSITLKSK